MFPEIDPVESFLKAQRLLMLTNHRAKNRRVIEALKQCTIGIKNIDPAIQEKYFPRQGERIRDYLESMGDLRGEYNIEFKKKIEGLMNKKSYFLDDLQYIVAQLLSSTKPKLIKLSYRDERMCLGLAILCLIGYDKQNNEINILRALKMCYRGLHKCNLIDVPYECSDSFKRINQIIESLYIADKAEWRLSLRLIKRLSEKTKEQICDDIVFLDSCFAKHELSPL